MADAMAGPIVFVSHLRVREGQEGRVQKLLRSVTPALERGKARTAAYLSYLHGSRLTIVHVFGDAEAMDLHFEGADQRTSAAYAPLTPEGWEIYGRPSDVVLEQMLREASSAGVPVTVEPEFVGGFLRVRPLAP